MATYLAFMAIGQFDVALVHGRTGIQYWDAIDSRLMADLAPPITPPIGCPVPVLADRRARLQAPDPDDHRAGGRRDAVVPGQPRHRARLGLRVRRGADGGRQRLDDAARRERPHEPGHRGVPGLPRRQPVPRALLTPFSPIRAIRPTRTTTSSLQPDRHDRRVERGQRPESDGWETLVGRARHAGRRAAPGRGLDHVRERRIRPGPRRRHRRHRRVDRRRLDRRSRTTATCSTAGSRRCPAPAGSADNQNTWIVATWSPAIPGLGRRRSESFDRQPEIIAWEADKFGPYPFIGGGRRRRQRRRSGSRSRTRPGRRTRRSSSGPTANDFVVVHELAHQWFGDSLAVDTLAGHLAQRGLRDLRRVAVERARGLRAPPSRTSTTSPRIPADDASGRWRSAIRGRSSCSTSRSTPAAAMTLQALRKEVGETTFFQILQDVGEPAGRRNGDDAASSSTSPSGSPRRTWIRCSRTGYRPATRSSTPATVPTTSA